MSYNTPGFRLGPEPEHADSTWWADDPHRSDRAAFYAKVAQRQSVLRMKFGSQLIATQGDPGPDIGERIRRAKANQRERIERQLA